MKKVIVILASVAAIFSASSCGKLLEVTPPNAIYDEQIQDILNGTDESKKQLVLNALASPFAKYFNHWGSPMPGGVLAPMTYCYQGIEQARSLQGNDMVFGLNKNGVNDLAGTSYYEGTAQYTSPDSEANRAHWLGYAYAINQANLLLGYMTKEAADKSASATDGRIRGLLVRGYSYMCLVEEYCQPYKNAGDNAAGLPLYTTYNPGQEPVAPSTLGTTWKFIIDDLSEAANRAGSNFTNGYDEMEDFDAGLANFLLARAYLLTGDWAKVVTTCDKIITSKKYDFIKNENYGCNPLGADIVLTYSDDGKVTPNEYYPTSNAFTALKTNPEVIFGYKKGSSYNPCDGSNRAGVKTMLQNPFGTYSGGSTVRIDDRLYNKIPANDIRKNAFYPKSFMYRFGTSAGETEIPSYSAMKYGATVGLKDGGEAISDKSLVDEVEFCKFRYSEVILMKAEAQANGGGGDAKATLDELLAARSIDPAKPVKSTDFSSDILEAVKLNWRIEMWGENGREYFNNKRWNVNINRSDSGIHWAKGLATKWEDMTLSIPKDETQFNPNY